MKAVRVSKSYLDWVAYCVTHDDTIWCSDWDSAMEAAWGHVVMRHGRNLDPQPAEVHAS